MADLQAKKRAFRSKPKLHYSVVLRNDASDRRMCARIQTQGRSEIDGLCVRPWDDCSGLHGCV